MKFDFLKSVTVSAAPVVVKKAVAAVRKQRQPESGLVIRLFKDGSVYPSNELVAALGLAYGKRDENNKATGFALDVVDSRDMSAQIQSEQPFVGVIITPRSAGKTDLFASVGYDAETGEPTADVATQGAATYGKEQLIALLADVYGADGTIGETGYIDLQILNDIQISSPDNRLFVFKTVSRGADKGKKTYVVRENAQIMPLVAVEQPEATTPETGDTEAANALVEVDNERQADAVKGKKAAAAVDPFATA